MDIVDKVVLGKRIQEQRKLKNLKQDKFAEMIGVSNVHMSEIERGNKTPAMETFIKIVNVLDVPADLFLRYEVNGAKPHILNDITEKLKNLTPSQLKMIEDLINAALENIAYLVRKEAEIE